MMPKVITNFLKRIWTDFKRKEFLPIKLLYFLVFGGLFTVMPFMTIQARSLGIREEEYGTVLGVLPIFFFLATSAIGVLADKIGNFKILCSFTIAMSGLTSLTVLAVPVARITHKLPEELSLLITCSSKETLHVELMAPYSCNYLPSENFTASIMDCRCGCNSQSNTSVVTKSLSSYTSDIRINQSDIAPRSSHSEMVTAELLLSMEMPSFEFRLRNNSAGILDSANYPTCSTLNQLAMDSHEYSIHPNDYPNCTCPSECDAHIPRQELCSNDISVEEFDPGLTIGLYILSRLLNALTLVFAIPLFEGATLAILQERNGDIGLQRLYSNIGQMVMTPLSGALIDAFSNANETNFRPAFYLYFAMTLLSALCILFIDLKFKKPAKRISKELKSLLTDFEVISLIIFGLILGIGHGVVDTFLFWLLQNMGASRSLMGLTVTVGSSFGLIIMIFATPIIERIGHINTIAIGLLFFVVRLLGYSLIQNPWLAMPFEAMECFTTSLVSVAQLSYAAALSTPTTIVTLQTLTMGTMHGFGRGIGGLIGGFLSRSVGLRATFQIIAALCCSSALVYFLLNVFVFRKRTRERKIQKEETKEKSEKEDGVDVEASENGKAPVVDGKEDGVDVEASENGKAPVVDLNKNIERKEEVV